MTRVGRQHRHTQLLRRGRLRRSDPPLAAKQAGRLGQREEAVDQGATASDGSAIARAGASAATPVLYSTELRRSPPCAVCTTLRSLASSRGGSGCYCGTGAGGTSACRC